MKDYELDAAGFAAIRRATGLSQQKFADRLGISKAVVENIELARSGVSPELAETIGALTGAVPWAISSSKGPRDFHDRPYSAQSWNDWQKLDFGDDEKLKQLIGLARDYLFVLLHAAVGNTAGDRTPVIFRTAMMDFDRFVSTQIKKHRLEARSATLMQEHLSNVKRGAMTVEQARREFRSAPAWKENEKRGWKPSTKVHYTVQTIPKLAPIVGFLKMNNGRAGFLNGAFSVRQIFDLEIEGQKFRVSKDKLIGDVILSAHTSINETQQSSGPQKRKRKA
jgi:transcriptional regulator with XRE-family HTH domain